MKCQTYLKAAINNSYYCSIDNYFRSRFRYETISLKSSWQIYRQLIYSCCDISAADILYEQFRNSESSRQFTRRQRKGENICQRDTPLTEAVFYILLAVRKPNHGYRGAGHEWDHVCSGEKGNRRDRGLSGGFDYFP